MYLWKCWRDTRIKIFVFLGLFVCLQLGILFTPNGANVPPDAGVLQNACLAVLFATSSVLLFVGWILGDESAGADIGRGSGDYLLTRPSSRGSFVWTGWAVGMGESIVLWIFFSATLFGDLLFESRRWGNSASLFLSAWSGLSKLDLPIVFLMFVINLSLVYGLTYCIGVMMRSGSKALVGSAALIFGYQILKAILRFRFHISLPEFLLSYQDRHHVFQIPEIHSFVVRAVIALALPALAHLVLERMEI